MIMIVPIEMMVLIRGYYGVLALFVLQSEQMRLFILCMCVSLNSSGLSMNVQHLKVMRRREKRAHP